MKDKMAGGPFGEDVMTIIMGIDPTDPGMHGKLEEPCPTEDAIGLVTKIRDMCEDFLRSSGKAEGMAEPEDGGKPDKPAAPKAQKFGDTGEEAEDGEE